MNLREKAAAETRKKLLKTGQKLIMKNGLSNVSVEDITNAAGVAKGTFYTYFKRKEDIVFEICREPFADIAKHFCDSKEPDLEKKLAIYFNDFMKEVERYGINICREWLRDVITPANVTDAKDTQKWQYDTKTLLDMLNFAVKNGELKKNTPTETLTHIIMTQMYGMMLCWCMSDGDFDPLDWTQKFCELQLNNILKPYIKEKK